VRRRTAAGASFGPGEALGAAEAVAAHTGPPDRPASPAHLDAGQPADLLALDADWDSLAREPPVLLTVVGGQVVHRAP
jgi:predicted amidohydrolase YtcJ